MIDFENLAQIPLESTLFEAICAHLKIENIELILCDDEYIKELNRAHRGIDKATDVLSFPLEPMPHAPLGTIIISVDTAKRAASEFGHSLEEELQLLFIHGALHLLGYDHECDEGQMRQKESQIIAEFHLPKSLIVRTLDV